MSLTNQLLNRFKQRIDGLELAPYGDGRFEVFAGDTIVYSKLKTGKFPNEKDVMKAVEKEL